MKKTKMLGNLTPSQFLRDYWQKKPLFIPQAFPTFKEVLNKQGLIELSGHEEAQSRLVQYHHKEWKVFYGPFKKKNFKDLGPHWTLLVQGVNHFYAEAQALLNQFNFIPYPRLDDLMISYAPSGGGVGPHFDSYDVFLLQGSGKRLWQISNQTDFTLLTDTPLKILQKFTPQQEWILEQGDMLYLPPNYAHNGIAIGDSLTYSIGFRAPSYQELFREFLFYLEEQTVVQGMYSDPQLRPTKQPAKISPAMIQQVEKVMKKIHFGKKEVADFLGKYLSTPKESLFFDEVENPMKIGAFQKILNISGIQLNLGTQLYFTHTVFYMNGEPYIVPDIDRSELEKLANRREIVFSTQLQQKTIEILYQWYLNGYIEQRDSFTS